MTLKNNRVGGFITSRGYRESKARGMSARSLLDAVLLERLRHVHADNYGVYGVRNMRHALQREGIDIGREQTYPTDALGRSVRQRQRWGTYHPRTPKEPDLQPDLVNREFKVPGSGKLWGLTLPMYGRAKASPIPLLSLMCSLGGLSGGHCLIRCGLQALPLQSLNQPIVSAKETSRVGSPLCPWLAVCQRCLQGVRRPARGCRFHRDCWRFL